MTEPPGAIQVGKNVKGMDKHLRFREAAPATETRAQMAKDIQPEDPRHMGFADLIALNLQLNSRLDQLWQRVLYSHAAIVGVMVFFGSTQETYPIARLLVFGFYSANVIITLFSFHETLSGMRAVINDLRNLRKGEPETDVQRWLFNLNYDRHSAVRIIILGVTWALLGYLLVLPLV